MTELMASGVDGLVYVLDVPLGWLSRLPRDVALLLFTLGTALLMTWARRAATNQHLLRRCAADVQQLRRLMREARAAGDSKWLARLRATYAQVRGIQLAADLRVLGAVLLPVAILATWASQRFDYVPPQVGEDLVVRADFPASSIGELTHLVPVASLNLKSAAIQVVKGNGLSPPSGTAEWTLYPRAAGEFMITIRHRGESVRHPVMIGCSTYRTPIQRHPELRLHRTEVMLRRYQPLGTHLGEPRIGLPPWMVGYLLLTLLLVPILKRLLRVA